MMASEPKQEQEPPVKQTPFLSYTSLREQVQLGVSKRTDFPLSKFKTALLIIDVQTYCCAGGGDYYTQHALPKMLSNIQKLVQSFRKHRDGSSPRQQLTIGCEVIFTMIQAQTIDGRDLSLDYKLSGVYFAKVPTLGMSQSDIFLPSLQPSLVGKGDIVIPKTSCSVFISTNLDYVLRNLHVEQLVICGQLTEQCVESAVRDAADLGYLVTAAEDACATYSQDRHDKGLLGMKGFCRTVSTSQVLAELEVSSSSNSRAQQGIIMQTENQQPTASSTTVETTTKDKGCTRIPQAPRADTLQSRKRRFPPPSKPRHLGEGCALAILKSLRCSGMKFLRYLSVDTTTTIQNYIIPIDVLLQSGSLVHPINDFNLVFIPDPASLQFLPYISKTAMMFGNVYSSENDSSNHAPQCSRSLLESIVQQALDQHDVAFEFHVELLFALHDAKTGDLVDDYTGSTASSKRLIELGAFTSDLYDQLKEQEIQVTRVNAGHGPGQLALALGLNEPVRIADQVLATQETIRAVAQSYSRKASFHHELKIFLSFDYLTVEDDPTELSDGGSHFIEGILQHGPALSVISSPSLLQKCDKKIRIGWATNRQNVTLRVFHDGFSQCLNLEYRLCDMSNCNIYLVLAIFLACGINGIDEKIVLRPSCDEQEDVSFSDQMIESLELDNFVMQQMGPVIGEKYLTHLQKEKNFGIGCQQMMDDI